MKKIFKSVLLVSASLSVIFLTSCKEDETVAPDRAATATISGTVKGNFDQRGANPGNLEAASKVKVRVTYSNADIAYTAVPAKDVYTIVKTAITDANGNFSIVVDAKDANVEYTVSVDDYVVSVANDTETKLYEFDAVSEVIDGLVSEGTVYVQLDYGDGNEVIGQ